ncbi:hypothetical protein [Butyrivibrio proteoclasticus]|nr:hypothetical protein [Butyrivibrio proteoclasticus]
MNISGLADGFINQPQIDVASLTDYDQMKDKPWLLSKNESIYEGIVS